MEYAEEGDIIDGDNEYAFGNDGNDEHLAESNNNNDGKYAKDSNIANNANEYVNDDDGVDKPFAEGNDK